MSERIPWYEVATAPILAQGDLIERCPIILPPRALDVAIFDSAAPGAPIVDIDWGRYDVVVLSQTCDLELDKVDLVIVCPSFPLGALAEQHPFFRSSRGKEELRRGNVLGYHLLAGCELPGIVGEHRVVELRTVFTIPHPLLKQVAEARGERLRLHSPYREHLAQAFARFIMRVGLPVDIPPFK